MNYGIKVMKVGYSVTDTDIRNILLSSKYNMLKYHSDNTTSLSINNGSSAGSVSVAHSLGFVPAFLSYVKSTELASKDYMLPYPGGVYAGTGYDIKVESYATSSNITIRVANSTPFGMYQENASDFYTTFLDSTSNFIAGNASGTSIDGAVRFTNVDLVKDESISSAEISVYLYDMSNSGGNLKIRTYGIDEDNTAAFSANPLGRDSTTSYEQSEHSLPSSGGRFTIVVTDEVREIIARAGWASGNALGFKVYNNASGSSAYFWDNTFTTYLKIVKSGSITFNFRVIIFKDRIDF